MIFGPRTTPADQVNEVLQYGPQRGELRSAELVAPQPFDHSCELRNLARQAGILSHSYPERRGPISIKVLGRLPAVSRGPLAATSAACGRQVYACLVAVGKGPGNQ